MNISETFIRRPIATSLLMLGIAVFGVIAYNALSVSDLPNVDFPTISVSASLPGADRNDDRDRRWYHPDQAAFPRRAQVPVLYPPLDARGSGCRVEPTAGAPARKYRGPS